MTEARPRPLYRADRKNFARLLGLDVLPDECVQTIIWVIAAHKAYREHVKRVKGHTPAKWAAETRRVANRMRRGHDGPEVTRTITDPLFGADKETFERLGDIAGDSQVPLEHRLAAIETRCRELEAMPEVDALYGARLVLTAYALPDIWYRYAVDRTDTVRQWKFVLAILEAAGEGTAGLREHPERLKHDVGRLLQLTAQPAGPAEHFVPLLSVTPP
jgi:hypothetical protein